MSEIQEQVAALAAEVFAGAHGWGAAAVEDGGSVDLRSTAINGALRQQRPTGGGGYRWRDRVRRERVKFEPPRARKGEVRLREFKQREAARCGVSPAVIYERLVAGKYPGAKVRRPHSRFVFVKPPPVLPGAVNVPGPSELPLKVYVAMEAARLRTSERAVYVRIYRGKYPGLEFRRVNQRVVFVKPAARAGNVATE